MCFVLANSGDLSVKHEGEFRNRKRERERESERKIL